MPGGEKCLAAGEARSRAVRSALRQAGRSAAFTIAASGVVLRGAGSGAGRDATPISLTGDPRVGIVVKGSFALNTAAPATDITDSYSYYVSIWAKGPYSPQPGFNPRVEKVGYWELRSFAANWLTIQRQGKRI